MSDSLPLPLLFELKNVTVTLDGISVIEDFSLRVGRGEAVVITGPSGSGKTVLARTIAGRHFFQGQFSVPDGKVDQFQRDVQLVEQQHRFRNRDGTGDQYYQQRFNSLNASGTLTVAEELEPYHSGNDAFSKERLMTLFGLRTLLPEPLIQLSNGENKRLQMVKALLLPHTLLILDQPYTGLDPAGREALSAILNELQESGESMLLLTSGRDIPSRFRRQVILEQGKPVSDGPLSPVDKNVVMKNGTGFDLRLIPDQPVFARPGFDFAFRLRHVTIRYGERLILDDLSWKVKRGECWSLSGPNGAGKSTLLSLITGDNPQAYANDIELFDRPRGTGESIWDIKRMTGHVSPELHLCFDSGCSVYAALASGLFDTIGLFRSLNETQDRLVKEWASFLGLEAEQPFLLNRLPAGKQRLVLIGRALIKQPALLILDEPCQGLDEADTGAVNKLVDHYCRRLGATLVYVSHYSGERPSCVTRFARLRCGRISVND